VAGIQLKSERSPITTCYKPRRRWRL